MRPLSDRVRFIDLVKLRGMTAGILRSKSGSVHDILRWVFEKEREKLGRKIFNRNR